MLRHRRPDRYGPAGERKAEPEDEQAVLDAIDAKLDMMRERLCAEHAGVAPPDERA